MPYVHGTQDWEDSFSKLMNDLIKVEREPYILGTPAWLLAYERNIQNDAEYKKAAQGWEGTVVLHILAKPEVGLDEDMYILLDLWHGDCRSVRLVPVDVGESGGHILTASYDRWKQVILGELDATKGLMQGKIKLKGDLPTIVRYAKAATRLAELAASVDTIFLDDMTPEEIESFKPWVEFIIEEYSLAGS